MEGSTHLFRIRERYDRGVKFPTKREKTLKYAL